LADRTLTFFGIVILSPYFYIFGKMNRVLFLLCFLQLPLVLIPQTSAKDPFVDSLKTALKNAENDTLRLFILNQLSETAPSGEWETFNEQMKNLAEKKLAGDPSNSLKKNYLKYLAASLNNLGLIFKNQGDMPKALECYAKSLKLCEEIGNERETATLLNNIGNTYESLGNIPLALEYLTKSLRLSEQIDDRAGMADGLTNIGRIYFKQGDLAQALEYTQKSLKMSQETGDKVGIANSHIGMGAIYSTQGNINKALEYYHKGLKISEAIGNKLVIAGSYVSMAGIYSKQGDLAKALEFYQKGLKINEEIDDKTGIVFSLNNIGHIYEKRGNDVKAMEYAKRSLALAQKLGFPENIGNAANLLSQLYKKRGEGLKALEMQELYIKMRDSINNQETRSASIKNHLQYQYEKKATTDSIKNAGELQVKELELGKQKVEKQNLLIISLTSIFVIVLLLLLAIYFKKLNSKIKTINADLVRQNREVEEKNEEINKQAVQIARYQSQMNPHFIFNAINGLQSMILEEDKITAIQQVQSFSKLLRLTLNNSENEYISVNNEIIYLTKYIEFELQRFVKKFKLKFIVEEGLDSEILIPSMIIQPVVENAIKHADLNTRDGGEINVEIRRDTSSRDQLLKIRITDNGKGIVKAAVVFTKGHESKGILITKKRIELEHKKCKLELIDYFSVRSPVFAEGPFPGTEVIIRCPYYIGNQPPL